LGIVAVNFEREKLNQEGLDDLRNYLFDIGIDCNNDYKFKLE